MTVQCVGICAAENCFGMDHLLSGTVGDEDELIGPKCGFAFQDADFRDSKAEKPGTKHAHAPTLVVNHAYAMLALK